MGRRDQTENEVPQVAIDVPQVDAAETFTVGDLAKRHGQAGNARIAQDEDMSVAHLLADSRHGWSRHEHYKGQTVRLTDADYLAALKGVHQPAQRRHLTVLRGDEAERRMQAALEEHKRKTNARGK